MTECDMEMWSVQTQQVIDTLERDGVYYVKNSYIDKKYQETAWIFKEAYRFFIRKASELVEKPEEAESPVWLFLDKRLACPEPGSYRLKLKIPKEEIILFDTRKWSKILNLSYVGTKQEEELFAQELTRRGIMFSSDVFEKPYYPTLKAEIIKSWGRLFDECKEPLYTQGAVWKIERSWLFDRVKA